MKLEALYPYDPEPAENTYALLLTGRAPARGSAVRSVDPCIHRKSNPQRNTSLAVSGGPAKKCPDGPRQTGENGKRLDSVTAGRSVEGAMATLETLARPKRKQGGTGIQPVASAA